jgi:hypothetical protein
LELKALTDPLEVPREICSWLPLGSHYTARTALRFEELLVTTGRHILSRRLSVVNPLAAILRTETDLGHHGSAWSVERIVKRERTPHAARITATPTAAEHHHTPPLTDWSAKATAGPRWQAAGD